MPLQAEFFDGLRDRAAGKGGAAAQFAHAVAFDLGGGGDFDKLVIAQRQRREIEAVGLDNAALVIAAAVAAALRIVADDEDPRLEQRPVERLHAGADRPRNSCWRSADGHAIGRLPSSQSCGCVWLTSHDSSL